MGTAPSFREISKMENEPPWFYPRLSSVALMMPGEEVKIWGPHEGSPWSGSTLASVA